MLISGDVVSVSEISGNEIDRFGLSKRELSSKDNFVKSPLKRMKYAEQNPGFESSQDCLGIEPHKIGKDAGNRELKLVSNSKSPCNFEADSQPQQNVQIGKEMCLGRENALGGSPVEKKLGSCREGNLEAKILPCTGELNKSMNEVAETSERYKRADKQPESPLLSPTVLEALQNAAKGEKGNGKGNNSFVFDVLKAFPENFEDDGLENASWMELAIANTREFAFPCPQWRKEKDKEKN